MLFLISSANAQLCDYSIEGRRSGTDLATGGTIGASGFYDAGYEAAKAFDNDNTTRWLSNLAVTQYIDYYKATAFKVNIINYMPEEGSSQNPERLQILGSTDGSTWTKLSDINHVVINFGVKTWYTLYFSNNNTYKYYRLFDRTTTSKRVSFYEIELLFDNSLVCDNNLYEGFEGVAVYPTNPSIPSGWSSQKVTSPGNLLTGQQFYVTQGTKGYWIYSGHSSSYNGDYFSTIYKTIDTSNYEYMLVDVNWSIRRGGYAQALIKIGNDIVWSNTTADTGTRNLRTLNISLSSYSGNQVFNFTAISRPRSSGDTVADLSIDNIRFINRTSYATVTAKDFYTNMSISNFSINLNNINYTTTAGIINTNIYLSDKNVYNVTFFNNSAYLNRTYINYNFSSSGNLEGYLYSYASIKVKNKVTDDNITSFSANVSNTVYYTNTGTITLPFESSNISLWNITVFNMSDLVDVEYNLYNFSLSGNLIAETYPNEQKIKAVKFFHDDPIEISSANYSQIYYAEFETNDEYKGYISTNLNVYSLVGGNYTCRNSINGTSYNTENEFYLRADSLNTIKILSDVFTLPSGRYSYNLECKVDANEFLVSEIYGKVLFNNLLDFYTTQSFTYTTTNNILSNKTRSVYLDSVIKTSSNTEFALNVSGNNYTYVFNETNLNQGYVLLLQDLPEATTYNFTYYSSNPLTVKSVVKEMIVEPDETNISRVNSVMIDQLYYKNITSVDVTVTNNTLLVSAFLNLNSVIADDIGIKLKIGTQEYYYFKSLEAGKNQPIAIEQVFNLSNGAKTVYLQSFASEGVTEAVNATLNVIDVDVFDSYTESLTAYARDIYKNTSLTNFSIWYDGTKFTSIDGDMEIFTDDSIINFTLGSLQNGGYFNKTYTNFNISNYVNASLHQTNVTFIFRHLASNQTITQNITAKDLKYSYTTLTTSSEDRFLFPVDVNYMIFNASNYVTRNQSLNLTPLQTGNIIVYLQPIVNFSIYDERTGLPFNLSIPNEIKVQIACANTPEVLEYIIDNVNDEVNLTCVYDKIKFLVEYDDSSYYRTYPNIAEVFSIDNFNFRAWLLELNTTTAIYNSFNVYDLFGDYINPKILLYKKIGAAEWLITGDSVDVEGKISAFLIQNTEYTIKVLSDNQPERVMGTYFADLAGESTIGLFDISLAADSTSFAKDVYHYIYLVNESGSLKVRAALNDSGSNVDSVRFVVRENDDSGAIICDQTSITNDVEFSCNVNGTGNSLFYAQLDVTKTTGDVVVGIISKIMKGSELIPFPYEFSTPNAQRYFFFFLILTVGFTATALTSYVSFLILSGLTLFLRVIGWFNISNFSGASTSVNLAIGGAVISIGLALAIGLLFRKGGQ